MDLVLWHHQNFREPINNTIISLIPCLNNIKVVVP